MFTINDAFNEHVIGNLSFNAPCVYISKFEGEYSLIHSVNEIVLVDDIGICRTSYLPGQIINLVHSVW